MIKIFPEPILRQVAKSVENFSTPALNELVDSMFSIMAQKNGAGLAAPQIGISQRVFVYGFDHNPRYPSEPPVPRDYAINPEIIWTSEDKISLEEGCLSFPGLRLMVLRSKSIVFKTFDLDGNCYEKEASGFMARIVQHETDHLNGVLFPDLAKKAHGIESLNSKPKIKL